MLQILRKNIESVISYSVIFIVLGSILIVHDKLTSKPKVPQVASVAVIPKPVTVTEVKPQAKPKAKPKSETECLAAAIYHEARGESTEGQLAVAEVIVNRKKSRLYPNNICKVVFQPHQFTGLSRVKYDKKTFKIAKRVLRGATDFATGATHFHTKDVMPKWASSPKMIFVGQIGDHLFYKLAA